jgi:hypothetical protein
MFQNETASSFPTEEHSNNTYLPNINTIYPSNKSSSAKPFNDESHTSKGKQRRSAIKRKSEQYQSSSTSLTTAKQSSRLAAKRVRLE